MAALALYIHVFAGIVRNKGGRKFKLPWYRVAREFPKPKRFGVKWVMTNFPGRKRLCWINQ